MRHWQPPPRPHHEWQPIGSAPRDGSLVVVALDDHSGSLVARFVGNRWLGHFGKGIWVPFSPEPRFWRREHGNGS